MSDGEVTTSLPLPKNKRNLAGYSGVLLTVMKIWQERGCFLIFVLLGKTDYVSAKLSSAKLEVNFWCCGMSD